jgi:hypothetical protein
MLGENGIAQKLVSQLGDKFTPCGVSNVLHACISMARLNKLLYMSTKWQLKGSIIQQIVIDSYFLTQYVCFKLSMCPLKVSMNYIYYCNYTIPKEILMSKSKNSL